MTRRRTPTMLSEILHFGRDSVVGAIIFVLIGAPGVGLSQLVDLLREHHVDGFTVEILELLAHAILISDAGLFVIYLIAKAIKAVREMFR